jgi:hypothetical protein
MPQELFSSTGIIRNFKKQATSQAKWPGEANITAVRLARSEPPPIKRRTRQGVAEFGFNL